MKCEVSEKNGGGDDEVMKMNPKVEDEVANGGQIFRITTQSQARRSRTDFSRSRLASIMRTRFLPLPQNFADRDLPTPLPTPFPIKIVNDAPPMDDLPRVNEVPIGDRNDSFYAAWDKFLALEPKRAKSVSSNSRKLEAEKREVQGSDGLQLRENAAKSLDEATKECQAKVKAIVKECKRLNQKYRDVVFNLEESPYCLMNLNGQYPEAVDSIGPPPWIKRVEDIFDDPQFFIDGASATDVHQGSSGDCWFLAALMAISAKKELIENLCVARDPAVGVYGFVFYRDGEWIYEVIDDKLYLRVGDEDDLAVVRDWDRNDRKSLSLSVDEERLRDGMQRGGEALFFSHCKSSETWLPLIEKAYAKAHGDYCAIEGGFASEGIEDLTGGVGVVINPEDIMDKERFWREQLSKVNDKYLFGGGSSCKDAKGFIGGHAYAVLQAWEEGDLKLLKLRNPWGRVEWDGDWSDGSKFWTAEMMAKLHFPSINRVRLFSPEWQVSQQWTCVSVPWTVEYLDTSFQFTISERGPVVVVLSQPDDRYYHGLRGRYEYALHFRVYKEGGDEDWLVRSMHNSGSDAVFTRSVSAELEDLEPGTYSVIFKVTATRFPNRPTAEESIMKYAIERKEKLLHVGRRYDYAYTKGNRRAMEMAFKKQKKEDARLKRKSKLKKDRRINQEENSRRRLRKQRVDDAMREKRKEFELQRRKRSKLREKQMAETKGPDSKDAQAETIGDTTSELQAPIALPNIDETTHRVDHSVEQPLKATETAPKGGEKPEGGRKKNNQPVNEKTKDEGALAEDLVKLKIDVQQGEVGWGNRSGPGSALSTDGDERDYESPFEPPEELDDDDFDWNSDIDGPVEYSGGKHNEPRHGKDEIFGDDPWNAMCVLGLRVYSLNSTAKVTVLKGENDS
nr:calpain-type cysteine protease adl1 [Quercus suber]